MFVGPDLGPRYLQYHQYLYQETHHGLVRIAYRRFFISLSRNRCLIWIFTVRSQMVPLKVQHNNFGSTLMQFEL